MSWFFLLILWDLQNLLSVFRKAVSLDLDAPPSRDFTVVVPIYGHPRYLANLEHLEPVKTNVLVAIDQGQDVMVAFSDELEAQGWRVCRVRCETTVGPPEIMLQALRSGLVRTTYAIRLDGDSYAEHDFGYAVAACERVGADFASVKVVVANAENAIENLQWVEYNMAMLSRHFRPWLTSGACHIARTNVFRWCLEHHSFWFPGEDTETGRIAEYFRFRVVHLEAKVYTDAPATFRAWYRQRRAWWAGTFRHAWPNFDVNLRHLFWMGYYMGLVYLTLAGKLVSFKDAWRYLPLIILMYMTVTFIANWQVRSRWMVVFPFYALFQVIVMPVSGALFYLDLVRRRRRTGRYRIGRTRQHVEWWPAEQTFVYAPKRWGLVDDTRRRPIGTTWYRKVSRWELLWGRVGEWFRAREGRPRYDLEPPRRDGQLVGGD